MNTHQLTPQDPMTDASPTRRDLLKFGALGLLAPGLLAGCGGSDTPLSYSATIADARSAILKALTDSGTQSISIALIERDRLVWAEAFGSIDKATGTAASTDTLYCIGSCSKVLAAISVMRLVDRGLVELDKPLVNYLPEFTMADARYTSITVRMLISHSSGFPGSDYRGGFTTAPNTAYAAQVMQTLATARLKHSPGEMSVYCNDGFTMVEPLVQKLTGKAYPQFVTDEILTPLGMLRSRYASDFFAAGSYAPGYAGEEKLPQEFGNLYATGGLYTTPSEMAALSRMLLNQGVYNGKRLLSAASIAEMGQNQTVTELLRPVAMRDGFGLGWDGVRQGGLAEVGVTAWHKSGGTSIYSSNFFVLPDEGLALMITGTASGYNSGPLVERILLQALVERSRFAAMPAVLAVTTLAEMPASDAQLAEMAGIYASYMALYRIEAQADHTLTFSTYAAGGWSPGPAVLKLRTDGSFSSDAAPNTSYQSVLAQGQRYLVERMPHGMGHYLVDFPYLQQVSARSPLSAAWQGRLERRWLAVNEPADSMMLMLVPPVFTLAGATDLPGYVLASANTIGKQDQIADASTSDSVALMCLQIPGNNSRDLDDVVILDHSGEEWVRVGSSVFRPEASVPALASGANTITIGAEGYAEWRSIDSNATAPGVAITGASAWKLYDSSYALLASGDSSSQPALAASTSKSHLLLYGNTGTPIDVTVS